MAVSLEEVKKIAWLARLSFDPDEVEKYRRDLSSMLDHFKMLNEVDISDLNFIHPEAETPLRDDTACQSLSKEEALRNAPVSKDGMFNVPKVI